MKKYLYFWIENFKKLENENTYLFENFGTNLSSQYIFSHKWDSHKLTITKKMDTDIPEFFYSENIVDLKAFVGNNGCGKTTLLTALFQLVARGMGVPPSGMGNFALVYKENNDFFIKTSLNDERFELIGFERNLQQNSHTSDYAVYYSTTFDDQEYKIDQMAIRGDLHGSSNISTNALLINDKIFFQNESTLVEGDYPGQLEALNCYYCMEQQRRTSFLCDFIKVKDFWSDLNLPRKIQLTVIDENVQNAFYELIHKQIDGLAVIDDFISVNCLDDSRWKYEKEYPKAGNLEDLKKEVLQKYIYFYDELLLADQFRFAAMMNFFRTWKDHNVFNLYKFNLKSFKSYKNGEVFPFDVFLDESIFDNEMLQNHCLQLLQGTIDKINSIINLIDGYIEKNKNFHDAYKNGFINNGKIFFDLKDHPEKFVKAVNLYNDIQKTSPFLFFGFNRALSSGESSMLKLYSRLYDVLKKQPEDSKRGEIHLFLDEIDLYLHPEWQRQWLQRFINGLKYISETLKNDLKCQVFLTTHSPFMLTDFLTENLLLLKREDKNYGTYVQQYENMDSSNCNFGANIYDLVCSGFFLKNTIGYFAENKIKEILNKSDKQESLTLLKKVGDPVLKALIDFTIKGQKK